MTLRSLGWVVAGLALVGLGVVSFQRVEPPAPQTPPRALDVPSLTLALGAPSTALQALWDAGELGSEAAPLVPAILVHLRGESLVARRLAAEALGKIGVRDDAVTRALREAHGQGDALLDRVVEQAMAALGGLVAVGSAMPESITWASTPSLKALELAVNQGWVLPDELSILERCREEAERHAARLESDRLFRLGEQTGANLVASLPELPGIEHELHWSPPFLFVAFSERKSQEPPPAPATPEGEIRSLRPIVERVPQHTELLTSMATISQAVYRDVLARHGAASALQPLEEPYGGRSDLPAGVRSFPEGYPMPVWVFVGDGVLRRVMAKEGQQLPDSVRAWFEFSGTRACVVVPLGEARPGPEAAALTAWSAAAALQHAFAKQHRRWKEPKSAEDALSRGIVYQWGSWELPTTGAPAPAAAPWKLTLWREVASSVRARLGGKRPWFPLERLLAWDSYGDAMQAAVDSGYDPRVGAEVARAEAWAFSEFLMTHVDPQRRAQWDRLVARRFDGPIDPDEMRKILGLDTIDGWETLEAEFAPWLDAQFAPPKPPEPGR